MAVDLTITVLWAVVPCSLIDRQQVSQTLVANIFKVDEEASRFFHISGSYQTMWHRFL